MKNVGSLMQGLKDKKVPCRISGCNNTWIWTGEDQLKAMSEGHRDPPLKMCDRCFELFQNFQDREEPCSNSDCPNTWRYNRIAQVADKINKRKSIPKRLCQACMDSSKSIEAQHIPCKISGCSNTWIWTGRDQMVSDSSTPPQKMCNDCYATFKTLEDKAQKCKIKGCDNTWTWTRISQLENIKKGRKNPPRKLCDSCSEKMNQLNDIELNCRVEECSNTWVWTRFSQLEYSFTSHSEEKYPLRMCPECSELYSQLSDLTHKCRIPECNGTWTEKRGSIFARKKSGQSVPRRLCDSCYDQLNDFEDKEISCKYEKFGCTGKWKWKRETQLRILKKTGSLPDVEPVKPCPVCEKFMHEHSSGKQIICSQCSKLMLTLSPEDLLRIKLGTRENPEEICNECRAAGINKSPL
ncbi:MAG: hypothetical protein JXR95_08660 [Deltaproteobacteria bacterium]|nr:hypothetical protein [Deltaproteobacteria bacterium]